ncbi:hypothetical protein MUY27_07095 [Mucilaginibacter sp. RS28]|uniref:Uncharacterized protein n=1 Tax=Mucilaginibacter straminoryzae TaxID=2932774 RepID=A0A9X1X1J6_9SPHI|nr:hypothetical protein [Mucilaginibacter straminoryzae]MCJ8209469.1 hypothetical protein [Mucilaginibacter straminoryzae]
MKTMSGKLNKLLAVVCLLLFTAIAQAQVKYAQFNSRQARIFNQLLADANAAFTLPEGFKESAPVDNEEMNFDYGITMPGQEFEIWFAVKPYKQISKYYNNPDSVYETLGKTQVSILSGDNSYFMRNLDDRILNQYNADAGKSYLLNLNDSPLTKHYKYALIITFQKDHNGTILAVCLTNDKGPDFFKYIDKARNCIRFKQ